MIEASALWQELKRRGFYFYSGVPDSTFGAGFDALLCDPEVRYVPAVREDIALGIVSAAYFCGRRGAVVMQNSGIGNVINALTSFNLVYQVPALLIVGWRGYNGADANAPEHSVMGSRTADLLSLLGIPSAPLQEDGWRAAIDKVVSEMERSCMGALLLPPGLLA